MTTAQDDTRDHLELPRRNPVPLIVAACVAVAIVIGLAVVLVGGDDDDSGADDAVALTPVDDGTIPAAETLGDPAPEVTFTTFEGDEVALADYEGQPVVLNFFASWCAPCVAEMPDLQAVSEEYAADVSFLGLNVQDALEDGQAIADDTGVTYDLARDPDGSIFAQFRAVNMPTTVFLDAEGNIVRVHTGRISAENLRQIIDQDLLA